MYKNKQAFTLIELLIVVLIIGILTAVALPQYQVAVKKAQLARLIPLAKTLASAEETYYLANGEYTTNLTALDIDVPNLQKCTYTQNSKAGYYTCDTNPIISYGVYDGPNNAQAGDNTIRYLQLFTDDSTTNRGKKGDIICFSRGEIARKACKTLGPGIEKATSVWDYYYKLD